VASDDCLPDTFCRGFADGRPGRVGEEGDCEAEYFRNMQVVARYYVDKGVYSARTPEERCRAWQELVDAGERKPPEDTMTYGGHDKGHYNELEAFRQAVLSGGPSPIGAVDGTRAFVMGRAAAESMHTGQPVKVDQSLYLF